MKKIIAMLLVITMVSLVFCGCSKTETTAETTAASTEATTVGADTTTAAMATTSAAAETVATTTDKQLTFGMLLDNQTNGWQVSCYKYAQAACDELGIKLVMYQCDEDSATQVDQLQSLIELGVDGLLLDPVLGDTGLSLLETCEKAGIPTVCFDRADYTIVDNYKCYISFVGPDSVDAGYQLGTYMLKDLGLKSFLELDGMAGSDPCKDRAAGFAKALKEYPDAKVIAAQNCDWDMTKAMNTTQDLLTANSNVDAIWAANDDMGLGAISAAEGMGLKDIQVGGMDCSDAGLQALLEGGQYKISVGCHYICSAISVITLYDYINGCEVDPMISFNMLSVTSDTAKALLDLNQDCGLIKGKAKEYSKYLNPNADPNRWANILKVDLS